MRCEFVATKIEIRRDELLGKEFETSRCGKCFIIDYKGHRDVLVMFYEPVYVVKCRYDHLLNGYVINPYAKTVLGVGYLGEGEYDARQDAVVHDVWSSMLQRGYDAKYSKMKPTYLDTVVCDEWLNFQNFAEWCYSQNFFRTKDEGGRKYHLDKDILFKGNKLYSPNTCCFVPQEINSLLVTSEGSRGDYPIGVSHNKLTQKYEAYYNERRKRKYLGLHNTPEEAFQAYKVAKEAYIKEVAEKWKGKIDDKVYQALLEWKIEITD